VITFTLTQTAGFNGSVPARITVFTAAGGQILQFNANSQQSVTLPATGTYYIVIDAFNLVTTGSYDLTVTIP